MGVLDLKNYEAMCSADAQASLVITTQENTVIHLFSLCVYSIYEGVYNKNIQDPK